MSEHHALLLDIDGTLMDTLDLIVQAMNAACEDLDVLPPFRSEELRTMIGTPVQRQVGELRDVTGSRADEFTERYHAHFIRGVDRGIRLFPGVAETFPSLGGRAMTTMSTRRRSVAEQMLRMTGLLPYFRVVVGGDQVSRPKPDPELPLFGAKALGVSPSQCFVIGDSPVDLFAGRAAGMKTIAVSYGYGDSKAIALARPDEVIHDFSGLPTALARFER